MNTGTGRSGGETDPRAENTFKTNIAQLQEIERNGGITEHARGLDLEKGFVKPESLTLTCSDERMPGEGELHDLGGPLFSLIVLQYDEKKLAELYWKRGVRRIKSHQGCGAAKAAYKAAKGLAPNEDPSWDEVDRFAQEETKRFCERSAAYGFAIAYAGHVTSREMTSSGHFHPGVAIYLDDVGGFDWRKVPGLVQGYTVSGAISGNPAVGVRNLIGLVAFGPGNAGDRIRDAIRRGEKIPRFQVYIVAVNKAAYDKRVAELKAEIPMDLFGDYIEFGFIEKPVGVQAWK